jgi:streptomycin 6-kinase
MHGAKRDIPRELRISCGRSPERAAWLAALPGTIAVLEQRWSLALGGPFTNATCSWVAPGVRGDTPVVLKIGMPHLEAMQEIDGLRFWNGDGTVRVFDMDEQLGAMLLERCVPGAPLSARPEPDQDVVIAALLRRLWRDVPHEAVFRPLSALMAFWRKETLSREREWSDASLVRRGLDLLEDLAQSLAPRTLLLTDLHAGNVLSADREPWLAIDPKPFIGDPSYDATQHLLNCRARVENDPRGTIDRFASLLGVDPERVRLWLFARLAAEPRETWSATSPSLALARVLGRLGP